MNEFEGVGTLPFDAKQGKGKTYYAFFNISMRDESVKRDQAFYDSVKCQYFSPTPLPDLKKGMKIAIKGKVKTAKNDLLKLFNPKTNRQYDLYETKVVVTELKVLNNQETQPNLKLNTPPVEEFDDDIPF